MQRRSKYKFLLSANLILFALISFAQFEVQYSGMKKDLNAVYFVDERYGYAAGKDGALIKTSDGGRRWNNISLNTKSDLTGLCFCNVDTGYIIGEDGIFKKTEDGGYSWSDIPIAVEADLTAINFINDSIGFIVGHSIRGGVFFKTSDRGKTWSSLVINENCNREKGIYTQNVSPKSGDDDWNYGSEIISLNYITSHDASAILNSGRGKSFMYLSDYKVESFEIAKSKSYYDYQELYFSSCFVNRMIGYFTCLVEGKSQIIKTIDLGESYMFLNPPTENSLYGVFFVNEKNGYFVGQNGTILHLIDKNNVIFDKNYYDDFYDPPFSIASPNNNTTQTKIHIYNVNTNNKENLDFVLYDKFGAKIDVKKKKVRYYSDEIIMKVKTDELALGTYFYIVKNKEQTLVNGKLNIGSIAQLSSPE
ncbi:MAG: hypothetical protein B6D61_14120 [Bacteroidetes bacterium 4484_249]|nr:MAG: hypothetical protein B6D61_14120 [Bacteroidetes bacterium 4484_249]